jgi:hypothetical protein
MIAENKVVCTDLVHNHNTDGSSILKQQINNSVKRKAQEDILFTKKLLMRLKIVRTKR